MEKYFKKVPSVKTLEPVFGERSLEARELLLGKRDPEDYERASEWVRQCYHQPPYVYILLYALDEVAETFGVECLPEKHDRPPVYYYLNTGDTYAATLIYNKKNNSVFVSSWGDIAEQHPYQFK